MNINIYSAIYQYQYKMMWKKVLIAGSEFLLKHNVFGTIHKVCLTDFIHLWFEDILEENLLCRCKEMNKLIEASDDVLLGYVWSLVDREDCNESDIIRDLAQADTGKILSMQTSLEGFKFRIRFQLVPANHSQFYEEVTQILLTTVCELDKRQQLLVDVIKTKDMEIEEYKLEGGQISRKAVETEPFDLEAFSAKCEHSISANKSQVVKYPSHVFTPSVQNLMEKITAAPLIAVEDNKEAIPQTKGKKLVVTLKSPAKSKKQKIYDDDEDYGNDNKVIVEGIKKEEVKVKEETNQSTAVKPKQNSRLKRALNNL